MTEELNSEIVQKAVFAASNLLSYRPRSRYELQQALQRKGYQSGIIDAALTQLQEHDLINDARFAQLWVEDRVRSARHSRLKVMTELKQKGIDRDVIDDAMTHYTANQEIEVIKILLHDQPLRQRYPDNNELHHYLSGRGFNHAVIRAALADLAN